MNLLNITINTGRFELRIVESLEHGIGMVDVLITDKHEDDCFDVTITDAEAKRLIVFLYNGGSVLTFLADKAFI